MSARVPEPGPGRRLMLHRALSKLGAGSRGQAAGWIAAGRVRVDGRTVRDPLAWVDLDRQRLELDGRPLGGGAVPGGRAAPGGRAGRIVLLLNKPRGVVTTRSDERGRPTVYGLLPRDGRWIFPVGRLDMDSEGLLLLTDDGPLAAKIADPESGVEKTYRVLADRPVAPEHLRVLAEGVELDGRRTRPARVRALEGGWLEIVLHEGRNRQVRRMLDLLGYRVVRLVRTRLGPLELGGLAPGAWRPLTAAEERALRRLP